MLLPILTTIAVVVIGFLVVVARRPSDFRVTRSATIAGPPEAAFDQVNDLHNWEAWSPWAKLDPSANTSYDGPPAGVGASFTWSGNQKIGEGRMTITDSHPYELVRFKLDFVKPFKGTNIAEFTFTPEGHQTSVTWSMFGKCNFVAKAIHLFINCDKMVGSQFEQGLAQMKAITELAVQR